jgi:uncharacterized protein
MSTTTQIKIGAFCWIDLATDNPKAAAEFYTELFGWDSKEVMNNEKGNYSMFRHGGKDVAGFYKLDGRPSCWMSYVLVDDLDAHLKKTPELSGQVYVPAIDVMPGARMAVVGDPTGAALALWESKDGSQTYRDHPKTLCWNELLTNDIDKAGTFYSSLLGWKRDTDGPNAQYTRFSNDGRLVGGMMAIPGSDDTAPPPFWLPYIEVEDLDGTVARAKDLGAESPLEGLDIDGVGRIAFLKDPVGAAIGLVRWEKSS